MALQRMEKAHEWYADSGEQETLAANDLGSRLLRRWPMRTAMPRQSCTTGRQMYNHVENRMVSQRASGLTVVLMMVYSLLVGYL